VGEEKQDYVGDVNKAWSIGGVPILDMNIDEGLDVAKTGIPSTEWQDFDKIIIASALKFHDIPYSFYDESHTNFFGSRAAEQRYVYSAGFKREALVAWLDRWVLWRLGMAVSRGEFELPAGMAFEDFDWEWVPKGLPWWRPLEEVKAHSLAVKEGYTSVQRVCKEQGNDYSEILNEKKAYFLLEAAAKKEVEDAGGRWDDEDDSDDTPTSTEAAAAAERIGT